MILVANKKKDLQKVLQKHIKCFMNKILLAKSSWASEIHKNLKAHIPLKAKKKTKII